MPNRVLKDSINESRGLTSCTFFAQDLYKRLITYADDYGRFNADPQIMVARLYPRELAVVSLDDLTDALIELVGVGKIAFYTSNASFLGNGRLNYCQDCCEDILKYFLKKKGTMESAVYFTCAKLDIPFIRRVYETIIDKKNSLQSKSNKDDNEYNIFSYYIDYLWGTHTLQKKTEVWEDFTDSDTSLDEFNTVKKSEDALKADYEKFELDWGKQTLEDYQFLCVSYTIHQMMLI